uniref:Predicted protein n=1 Tax=Hordeum vulgare subsp. vulgare TaxID=112509 RepID=F2E5A8_HORVV|nr:predicted protein [Hordeum vulgare subsp. vulgare]
MHRQEESGEDIVIVGAGLAGLAAALGLHRKRVRSVVLESSPELRASGFAFATWPNAFRALDALGVGDEIRKLHLHIEGLRVMSSSTGEIATEVDFRHEFCCAGTSGYGGGGASSSSEPPMLSVSCSRVITGSSAFCGRRYCLECSREGS